MTASKPTIEEIRVIDVLPHIHNACTFGAAHLLFCVKPEDNNDVHNWKADPTKVTELSESWVQDYVKPIESMQISYEEGCVRTDEFHKFTRGATTTKALNARLANHPLGYILPLQQLMQGGLDGLNSRSELLKSKITPDNMLELKKNLVYADSYGFSLEHGTRLRVSTYYHDIFSFSFGGVFYKLTGTHDSNLTVAVRDTFTCEEEQTMTFNNYEDMLTSLANHRINILKSVTIKTPYGEMSQYDYMSQFMGL